MTIRKEKRKSIVSFLEHSGRKTACTMIFDTKLCFPSSDQILSTDFNYFIDVADWRGFKMLCTMAEINGKFNFLPQFRGDFLRQTRFIFHKTFQ
jgi:hypothetical protein